MAAKFQNLQALRGIACLLVVLIHLAVCETVFGIARPFLRPYFWFGYAGVDLFFVLSGFLIFSTQAKHSGQPAALPGYLFRRAWRIYPAYWLATALAVGAMLLLAKSWAKFPDDGPHSRWVEWLTLWTGDRSNAYMVTAWTLPYEVLFYAAFGLLIVLPKRIGWILLPLWACYIIGRAAFDPAWSEPNSFLRHFANPLVLEFLLGCAIAFLIQRGYRLGWWGVILGLAWGATWALLGTDPADPVSMGAKMGFRTLAWGPTAALCVWGFVSLEERGRFTFPRWLQFLGDASYSIYLIHLPVMNFAFSYTLHWKHDTLPHLAWIGFMLILCVGSGVAFHLVFEKTLLKWGALRKGKTARTKSAIQTDRISIGDPVETNPIISSPSFPSR